MSSSPKTGENHLNQVYTEERDDVLKRFSAWTNQDQVDFVKNLLQTMSQNQHGQIEEFFQPILKRDFISLSPGIIPDHILSLLDAETLVACAQVSKNWRRAIANGMMWKKLAERKVRNDPIWKGLSVRLGWKKFLFISKERATRMIAQAQCHSQAETEKLISELENPLEFQNLFYCRLYPQILNEISVLNSNWLNGRYKLEKINCESENNRGVYCIQYDNDKIISGLRDTTIKIWRRGDLQCERRLSGHTGSVLCLQYDSRVIVSGSSDATVRIWDTETGEQLNTLVHHGDAVLHLRFANGTLITCSKDRSIAVWNMVSPQEINLRRVLVGHRAAVNVVDFDDVYVVSASGDRTIKVWNADTCEFVRTLNGHTRGVACLQYRDRLVVSGSSDNTIRLWDVEVGNCLRVLEGHEELVRCIRFDSKRIVSGAYDGKIKIWDLKAAMDPHSAPNSICTKTLMQHTGRVFRLQFDEFQIVSSSHDDSILIFNFLNVDSEEAANNLPQNEAESSSAATDLMSHLSIAEREQLLSQLYIDDRNDALKKFTSWKCTEQVDFVKNLLQTMSHHQHGQIEEFFQPILKRDFITKHSRIHIVFIGCKNFDGMCTTVAHGMLWRKLIERKIRTDPIWKGLSERRGWNQVLFISKERATQLIALVQSRNQSEADQLLRQIENPFEFQHNFYCRLYPQIMNEISNLEDNWRNGEHWLQRINCESENSKGVYCLQYDDEKIISGLRDTTIKVWRRSDLQCDKRLAGHTGSVLCLQYDSKVIISGSSDSTVRIWSVDTGEQLNTLVHHSEAVLHLRFTNGMLVTCSKDRSIAVWDMVSPQEINLRRVLVGHRAAVNVVDFDHIYIVSASGDRTIKVWNADTCEFVRTLSGHTRGIACLQYRDRLVVSGSSDNTIRLWDIEVGNCLRVLEGHEELVRCIRFDSKRIVSGAYDGKIKIWDLKSAMDPRSPPNSICLKTLEQHTGRVFRLQFDEFQIVSSSHDDTILIWNFLKHNDTAEIGNLNMGAWPALAHSSHRVPNSNPLFGAGDGPAMRMRRRNENPRAAAAVQDPLPQGVDVQMEVDEPANNGSDSDTNNSEDEEIQLAANG
ncbi:hypothetical protein M3Y97_00283700 [Aphelenchoides bicaudatus]|nr:hypothetical protein M3Y97_00283700 [Aphelenchoides bicaudatus]